MKVHIFHNFVNFHLKPLTPGDLERYDGRTYCACNDKALISQLWSGLPVNNTSPCECKMSINCFLPNICVAKKMNSPDGDDRPFPEQDYLVFPVENMYDRIVLPDKGVSVANNNSQEWQNRNKENRSSLKIEGK